MVYELAVVTGVPALVGFGIRCRYASWWALIWLLVGLALLLALFYHAASVPRTSWSILLFCLSLGGGIMGFLFPGIWRNIIAPHVITLLFWAAVGGYLYYAWHYLPAVEFASQVASLRRPFDYILWLAAKTDEPLVVAAGIFGGVGLCVKILRSWLDRLVGRLLGGNC
ncbi:MAG: hypothetical protein G01um101429_367 [Parcubacteria group bacterium Gr01-1014_29]|nr:MAG: hypothetical protein G01um101429_367 [Parcubacteria group bacterium Gr01-1014_29]